MTPDEMVALQGRINEQVEELRAAATDYVRQTSEDRAGLTYRQLEERHLQFRSLYGVGYSLVWKRFGLPDALQLDASPTSVARASFPRG